MANCGEVHAASSKSLRRLVVTFAVTPGKIVCIESRNLRSGLSLLLRSRPEALAVHGQMRHLLKNCVGYGPRIGVFGATYRHIRSRI